MRTQRYVLLLFLALTLVFVSRTPAKAESQNANGFYDTKILEGSGSSVDTKKPKKKKHKSHKKSAKTGNSNSAPGDPQEEVTDQKEVSSQADEIRSNRKK